MRLPLAIALIAGLSTPVLGQTVAVSPRPERTALVIYRFTPVETSYQLERLRELNEDGYGGHRGLAMIIETRTVDVPAGEAVIRFEGLASGIIPETAAVDGLPGAISERNTDFEVLTPGGLLQHSIGDTIQVVRVDRATGRETILPAVVRSGARGPVLEIDGKLEALSCGGLTQRLIFDRVPEGLSRQPVLSVRTRSAVAGRHTVRVAYLAQGLDWSADYVARLAPDGASMDMEGWITLMNFSDTGFTDTAVQVVAGNLNLDGDTEPMEPVETVRRPECWPLDTTTQNAPGAQLNERLRQAGRSSVVDYLATVPALSNGYVSDGLDEVVVTGSRILPRLADLGDYKIYTLPETTDLNARQAKQIRFFDQSGVRFSRTYQLYLNFEDDWEPLVPRLLLRLRNEVEDGLGVPMPGGGVSLVETQDGVTVLTGQASFMDRGEGTPLELEFGEAMDLSTSVQVIDEERWSEGDLDFRKATVETTLTNEKAWPVEIEVLPDWQGRTGYHVLEESQRSVVTDAGYTVWRIRVPAHGAATLRFTARIED
jgi:hypothetical protein